MKKNIASVLNILRELFVDWVKIIVSIKLLIELMNSAKIYNKRFLFSNFFSKRE